MVAWIQNYKFDKQYARNEDLPTLFHTLISLIEIHRKANLYRTGVKNHQLDSSGICGNLNNITFDSASLTSLFFNGSCYPITPFNPPESVDDCSFSPNLDIYCNFRWGNNEIGNTRMKLLELMIKDLTHYLIKEAM